ncbi:MAG: ABC transporter permease [Lewinellaceae bacterium]|nr:ABC transporter permease [Phaeodactylibacter sp.]MCB9348634.1 ABC transporter permease [Lewinellaceae bacterium]
MNLSLRIARRYLFAKKSTNAINIITGIAVFGIAVGSAALVLVLSVFNGFEDLITTMYSNFNPDIKVTPARGKTFEADTVMLEKLMALEGVAQISRTLEEVAFFEYKDNQDFGTLKGVDENFSKVVGIDTTVREGRYSFEENGRQLAILGLGMRNKLGANVGDRFTELAVYMPKREQSSGLFGQQVQPFRRRYIYPGGTFVIQQEFDNQYVLAPLEFARELSGTEREVSALEIRMAPGAEASQVIASVQAVMGADFDVKGRYEQESSFLRLMQVEKWLSYAIASLMMLLVAFNIVGALWMVVLEKQKDIAILKSMGALDTSVRNIFLNEGLLLSLLGIGMGFILAIVLYMLQKTVGIVSVPGNFVVDAYPISMRLIDFIIVAVTVTSIGVLASVPPALRAMKVSALIREE